MAKSKKTKRKQDEDEEDEEVIEAEPFEKEEEEYDEEDEEPGETAPPGEPRKSFFQQVGDGLKAAGSAAGRYTKIGITMAELEKLRYNLRSSYQRMGETVVRCWDAAPDIGVSASDSDVKELFRRISALRRQIREVEAKVRDLKNGGAPVAEKTK